MSLNATLQERMNATECTAEFHVFADGMEWCQCDLWTRRAYQEQSKRRWNGGVLVSDILASINVPDGYAVVDRALTDVATDEEAGPTDLAWISETVTESDPRRVIDCQAGLVFVPLNVGSRGNAVAVPNPRLTFTRVVAQFFPAVDAEPVIGRNVTIGAGTVLKNCVIGDNVEIGANCVIGGPGFGYTADEQGKQYRFPHRGKVLIGDNVSIGSNTCIDRGALGDTIIRRGAKIDNLVHVAHNVFIGENALVVAGSVLCGGVQVGPNAWIGAGAQVREQLLVGSHAVVGMGAVVVKNVSNGKTVMGNPAKPR